MEPEQIVVCPVCSYQIQPEWFFCPKCGKMIREAPIVISISKQILIYLVSFFLAPFGLGWGFKYIKSKDLKVRMVGIIAIVLTILSIVLMIVWFKSFMDQYAQTLNSLTRPGI